MKKELLEEILKINHFYNRMNEAVNPAPAVKFVKSLIKDIPEGAFKKMFANFGKEEENAYEILQRTKNKAGDVESAVGKLIQSLDFSKLASHLIENKKLGTQIENFINTKISNIKSGNISKEKALKDLEDVLSTWTENEGIPELGPELFRKVAKKLEVVSAPDVSGILKHEAEEIFRLTGKQVSTADAQLLNKVYRKLTKLSPEQIIQVENALKRITSQDGLLQQSINRMKQAKDMSSKLKAENAQKLLDNSIENLNMGTTSIGKIKLWRLIKSIGTVFLLIVTLSGVYIGYKVYQELKSQLQSIPFIGNLFPSSEPSKSSSNNLIPDAEKWLKENGYWSDGMKLTTTDNPNEVIWTLNGQQGSISKQNDGSFK
jgi:hypothetical protein